MTILVLEFKKIQINDKHYITSFIQTQKEKQLLMKLMLMVYLNQCIILSYQTYKNL